MSTHPRQFQSDMNHEETRRERENSAISSRRKDRENKLQKQRQNIIQSRANLSNHNQSMIEQQPESTPDQKEQEQEELPPRKKQHHHNMTFQDANGNNNNTVDMFSMKHSSCKNVNNIKRRKNIQNVTDSFNNTTITHNHYYAYPPPELPTDMDQEQVSHEPEHNTISPQRDHHGEILTFNYDHDFDKNGFIHYLGTNHGVRNIF
eukprot:CAMPEP_0201574566 /NCGR_PEP_ID=MMETSP0190_2-20130828/19137_1 /ASSEMBLY_ACC=CAM_ASM_000263 /TAXON_ID=37353 /ORGANISM="Rosalina sp." /LENGTH=204 /DNA_ID=CAMNT_0048002977 /DNA_START=99 /DNA_END=710 /DNA_ORIENTATION=-